MANVRNKNTLAAKNRENDVDFQARNTNSPGIQEDYITQVSEKIEGRVTKKLSQEFSRTKSRILGTLSQLDESLQNPQFRAGSGPIPRHPGI